MKLSGHSIYTIIQLKLSLLLNKEEKMFLAYTTLGYGAHLYVVEVDLISVASQKE